MKHEAYMKRLEQLENAGKEAYGGVDLVNNPPHYNQAGIECVDAIAAATDDGFNTTCKETSSNTSGDTDTKTESKTLKKPSGISTN